MIPVASTRRIVQPPPSLPASAMRRSPFDMSETPVGSVSSASTAGPPSPEKPWTPVPATVEMVRAPRAVRMRRTRAWLWSATQMVPRASRTRPAGWSRDAAVAGPPSPTSSPGVATPLPANVSIRYRTAIAGPASRTSATAAAAAPRLGARIPGPADATGVPGRGSAPRADFPARDGFGYTGRARRAGFTDACGAALLLRRAARRVAAVADAGDRLAGAGNRDDAQVPVLGAAREAPPEALPERPAGRHPGGDVHLEGARLPVVPAGRVDPTAGRAVVAERRLSPLRDARRSGLGVRVWRDPGVLAVARRAEAAVEEVELLELAGRPRRAARRLRVHRRAHEPVRGAGHGERDLLRRDRRAV